MTKTEQFQEIGAISACIADHFTDQIYKQSSEGYVNTMYLVANCAIAFFEKTKDYTGETWEEIYESGKTAKRMGFTTDVSCWEDAILDFSTNWFLKKEDIKLEYNWLIETEK